MELEITDANRQTSTDSDLFPQSGTSPVARSSDDAATGPTDQDSPAASVDGVYTGWRSWPIKNGVLTSAWDGSSWSPRVARQAEKKDVLLSRLSPYMCLIVFTPFAISALILTPASMFPAFMMAIAWAATGYLKWCGIDSHNCTHSEDAPHPHGKIKTSCGLYAWHSLNHRSAVTPILLIRLFSGFRLKSYVGGDVALWGKVIEHQHGAVGQYAYPLAFTHVSCIHCGLHTPIDGSPEYEGFVACHDCNFQRTFWNKPRFLARFTTKSELQDLAREYGLC